MLKRLFSAVAAVGLLLGAAASADAADVTVQVEGRDVQRGPVAVTTPATVNKDGTNTCPGNTAVGALEAGTSGDWSGDFMSGSYTPTTVLGETHAFGSGAYWSIYINGRYQNAGVCHVVVHDGDEVLIFASDDPFVPGSGGFDEPVLLQAPAVVTVGQPFAVKVVEAVTGFDDLGTGTTEFHNSVGATVIAGDASATTGADGTATLTVTRPGPFTYVVTKGNRAPDRAPGCATTGSDGLCGTSPGTTTPFLGDGANDTHASFGRILGVSNGARYKRKRAPRELRGRVDPDPSGIKDIELRITRRLGKRCTTYDARTERHVRMKRCGAVRGRWFSVGDKLEWSYLLPGRLPRGRWVIDMRTTDGAGNVNDNLIRGRSRMVFHVVR